jgi:hypothetical protein
MPATINRSDYGIDKIVDGINRRVTYTVGVASQYSKCLNRYIVGKAKLVGEEPVRNTRVFVHKDMLLTPVINIRDSETETEVYNLEVADINSYIVDGFVVHNCNEDHTQAKGVILDTHLRVMEGLGTWRLLKLLAFDRTRDADLVKNIMDKTYNSYSMGAYVDGYTCSICHKPFGTCSHIPAGLKTGDVIFLSHGVDKLLFKNVVAPEGFETSSVKTPAFVSAVNDNVMDMSQILNDNIGKHVEESTIIQLANLDSIHRFSKKDLKLANLNFGEGCDDY